MKITDWDDAYANGPYIPNGDSWPAAWVKPAAAYRATCKCELDISYGQHERQSYDLFLPDNEPKGLFIFVHGGYWLKLDKSYWSHLAKGAVDRGFAVVMPSYVLCPEASIEEITKMVGQAIDHAASKISGPIILSGHSAGGHLVSSMVCENSPLLAQTRERIVHTVSISGIHDLRPLLQNEMNDHFGMSEEDAVGLSPALKRPVAECRLTAWVGGNERPEFIRQSELIANIWQGLGAQTSVFCEPDRHHFDVIDGLADPNSSLTKTAFEFYGKK